MKKDKSIQRKTPSLFDQKESEYQMREKQTAKVQREGFPSAPDHSPRKAKVTKSLDRVFESPEWKRYAQLWMAEWVDRNYGDD